MLRILGAFVWLRWRMLINSLEKTSARDTVERFSIAIEKLGPIMAAVLMIPSALLLAAAAAAGGFSLARGEESLVFIAAHYLLRVVPIVSIFGPLLLPAADRTNPIRLLLLPIPRGTLYVAQSSSAFGDVWVLVMLPIVLFVPIGLLAGGAVVAALISLAAGALLVLVVVGITSLATSVLHLLVRNRRRGELLALLFIVIIPAASMLPGLLSGLRHVPGAEHRPSVIESTMPEWVKTAGTRAFTFYPPELYVASARAAASGHVAPAAAGLAGLTVAVLLIHTLGMVAFATVLASPGSTGARRAVPTRAAWGRTLPGLSSGGSAVALAQLRLALRTPRGRSTLLSPVLVTGIFAFVIRQPMGGFESGPMSFHSGLSLAAFASFVGLMAILPIAMNQFAIDNAGLTLALLSPLSDREYLAGKAVGNGLIAALPIAVSLLLCLFVLPGGSAALWLSIPLALLATYFLVAPAAAIFSALFPRVVDLNSIGRGSNAHGLAGLLGMLSFVAAGAPSLLIAVATSSWLRQPALAPVLLVVWCAVSYAIGQGLFILARRIFAQRRENLAMLL